MRPISNEGAIHLNGRFLTVRANHQEPPGKIITLNFDDPVSLQDGDVFGQA